MSVQHLITEEEVTRQLDSFDIKVSDPVVVSRIQETCNTNGIPPDKFVDEWILHSLKADTGEINFVITPQDLDRFLPELLRSSAVTQAANSKPVSMVRIENARRQAELPRAPEDMEMIERYADDETKEKARKEISSVHALLSMEERNELGAVVKTETVDDTPYATRKNASHVIALFNEDNLPEQWKDANLTTTWCNDSPPTDRDPCMIELISSHPAVPPLTAPYKYMYIKLNTDALVMEEQMEEMVELMAIELDVSFDTLETCGQNVWFAGRVATDFDNEDEHANSEMKSSSFVIVGSSETPVRQCWAKLDLSGLDRYSIFPGQIIAVRGWKDLDERCVHVKQLKVGVPPPLISRPITTHALNVYIVSGPYTPSHNLEYQPLKDFVKVISEAKPDLLLVLGPIVSEDTDALGTMELLCSYEELFRRKLELILDVTIKIGTKVVLIPSQKELFHHPIFPTPPYPDMKLRENIFRAANPPKIGTHSQLYPNPAQFDFNTIRFAVSTVDIVTHMAKREVGVEMTDRFSRILEHLFSQRRFYPLYPPSEEVNLEITKSIHLAINERPHVLVIPSLMKEFIRMEGGTLCVNPGRLVKGKTGGSFCRLRLSENGFSGQIIKI